MSGNCCNHVQHPVEKPLPLPGPALVQGEEELLGEDGSRMQVVVSWDTPLGQSQRVPEKWSQAEGPFPGDGGRIKGLFTSPLGKLPFQRPIGDTLEGSSLIQSALKQGAPSLGDLSPPSL